MADAPVDEAELRRRPSLRLRLLTFAVVVAVVVVPVLVFGTVADLMRRGPAVASDPKTNGVAVTSCRPDARGKVQIKGTAHNTSHGSAFYAIQLDVYDRDGNDIGDADPSAFDVGGGRTVNWIARTNVRFAPGVTCAASNVVRLPPVPPTS